MVQLDDMSLPGANPVLLSNDEQVINQVCMRYHNMYTTREVINNTARGFIQTAIALINKIQRDYHLK